MSRRNQVAGSIPLDHIPLVAAGVTVSTDACF
jgi:hypothetical protein